MPVSTSPCCRASCAKKFAPRGLMVGVSAKKFALHAQNTPKSAFYGVLGEFFRGNSSGEALVGELIRGGAAGAVVLGELFRGRVAGGVVLGELFRGGAAGAVVLGEYFRGNAGGGGVLGKFADRLSWDPTEPVLMQRAPGRALLLAASALQCAATPT